MTFGVSSASSRSQGQTLVNGAVWIRVVVGKDPQDHPVLTEPRSRVGQVHSQPPISEPSRGCDSLGSPFPCLTHLPSRA